MSKSFLMIAAALLFVGTALPASAQNYGAIAYSPRTGASGYSYDFGNRARAERAAMRQCRLRGRGCRIAVWFRDGCGAVASGPRGWGSGWGANRQIARRQALRQCRRFSGRCQIRVRACTTR